MSSSLRGGVTSPATLLRRSRPVLVLVVAAGLSFATLAGLAGTIRVGR